MQTTSFDKHTLSSSNFSKINDAKNNLAELIDTLSSLNPSERLKYIFRRFSDSTIVLNSAGVGSAVIPGLIHEIGNESDLKTGSAIREIPIILIDTGALFNETIEYAKSLQEKLGLNFLRVSHALNDKHFLELTSQLILTDRKPEEAFDQITKVYTLGNLLKQPELLGMDKIEVIVSGNRRADSPSRSNLKFAENKNGRLFIYPIADLSDRQVDDFYRSRQIKEHPLKDKGYLSVGNIHDSRKAKNTDKHPKAGRHSSGRQECGLHLHWALEKIAVRIIRDWSVRVKSPSLEEIILNS